MMVIFLYNKFRLAIFTIVFAIHNCKMGPSFKMEHLITITSSPKPPFLIACIASVSVRLRWEIACSKRSDSGVWREGKEREKNKEENRGPTSSMFFFSSHLLALSPRDLNAWNRLAEKGGNQRLHNSFIVNGGTCWTKTQFLSGKEWIRLDFLRSTVWSCSPRDEGDNNMQRLAIGPKNDLASNV